MTLTAPVQENDIPISDGIIPATFKGRAKVSDGSHEHEVALSYRNIRLEQASHCP